MVKAEKKYHQVGKSKKIEGKNTKIKGFDFFPSMPVIIRNLKPKLNPKTKEGKKRILCIIIVILLVTSGGFKLIFL